MSVSEKQIAANRKNAQKSTGPKTPQGIAAVKKNALKHGFYASDDVVVDSDLLEEDKQQYDLLLESLYDELKPTTIFQEFLVRRIANSLWRSRRAIIAETAQINEQLENTASNFNIMQSLRRDYDQSDDPDESDDNADTDLSIPADKLDANSIPNAKSAQNILRYEMRLDRQLTRAYKLLKHLQLYDKQTDEQTSGRQTPSSAPASIDTPKISKSLQNLSPTKKK